MRTSEDCRFETIIYDEETLMKMTDEELQFFENYKRENMPSWKCTICPCQFSLVDQDNIRIHPALGVIVCKSCEKLYSLCPFTKDENGHDEYCRCCAEIGTIICCDTCTNVFCKACLRRCLGREHQLEITSSKCKWSCFVCNNLPLWSQRALCRMVMLMMQSTPGRKSLSRRSLQNTNVSSDPSIWWPAIISKAEKLAEDSKALVSNVQDILSQECGEADGSSCHLQTDKVFYEAVDTTRLYATKLEKLIVEFLRKRDNTENIKVNQRESTIPHCPSPLTTEEQSDNSSSNEAEKQPNKTTENVSDEVFFKLTCSDSDLEFPMETDESREESVIGLSTDEEGAVNSSGSNSSLKSICSQSSPEAIRDDPNPTEDYVGHYSSSNEAEAQPNAAEKTRLPTVEDTLANDESVELFYTASELTFPDSSSSSSESEETEQETSSNSEESFLQVDYASSSSPEIDLNEKARKRKSSDSDDSLAELKLSPRVKRTKIRRTI